MILVVCADVVKALETLISSWLTQVRKSVTVVAEVDDGEKLIARRPLEHLCRDR